MDAPAVAVADHARASRWDPRRRMVMGATAATGLIGAALFYTVPAEATTDVWMISTGIMLALLYAGVLCFRRDNLRPWLLVAAGLSSAYLAMFLMNYGSWFGLSFGSPSVLDALSLANYPLATFGAILMLTRQHLRTGLHALLETVTLTVAGGLLIFVFVGVRATEAADASAMAKLVAVSYPLGNVLLLAVLAVVAVRLRTRPGGILLVALGFAGNLAADLVSSWQRLEGTYAPGGWVDFGWLLCFIGLSMAPSWPDRGELSLDDALDRDEGQVTRGRMAILLVALFSAPVILIGQQLSGADAADTVAVVGTIVVFALALARIALYNADLRRNEAALRAARDELQRADEDKQALLWRMNRAVEEERKRIAADIHDRPVQQLAAVGYKVETVSLALMTGDLDRASDLTDEVADELSAQLSALRNLMTEVRPPVLDERGLFGALSDLASQFGERHDGVEVRIEGADVRLDPEVETVLYRVAQEALTNIAKHAAATTVEIGVHHQGDRLCVAIADDGAGFDTSQRHEFVREGHFGLAGMGERLAMVDGELTVDSSPGQGTEVRLAVPHSVAALVTTGVEST